MLIFLFLFSCEDNDTDSGLKLVRVAKEHKPKTCYFWNMFNHSMWIIRSTRNDSLVQKPSPTSTRICWAVLPMGCFVLFSLTLNWGIWKPNSSSNRPELFHLTSVDPCCSNGALYRQNQQHQEHQARNVTLGPHSQTYWVSICILTRFLVIQAHENWEAQVCVSVMLLGEEKLFHFLKVTPHFALKRGMQ